MGRMRGASVVAIVVGLVAAGCSWGQYGHDGSRAAWSPAEKVLTPANVNDLAPLWETTANTGFGPRINYGHLYAVDIVSTPKRVLAFQADGSVGCSGSPRRCTPKWTAQLSTRMGYSGAQFGGYAVDRNRIYVVGSVPVFAGTWRLEVFDAHGEQRCTGTPKVCQPLWSASWGLGDSDGGATLAVANDLVYVSTPGNPDAVTVFDADGVDGCTTATPAVCTPRFRTAEPSGGPIAVDATRLLTSESFGTSVFDASGVTGCVSAVCSRLRLFPDLGFTSIANGRAYSAYGSASLTASTGCTGTPPSCPTTWSHTRAAPGPIVAPAVAAGRVLVAENPGDGGSAFVEAFDAAGQQGCAGAPRTCNPLVQYDTNNGWPEGVSATGTLVFASSSSTPQSPPKLLAWDLAASVGCAGAPLRCVPLGVELLQTSLVGFPAAPAVTNGIVAVGGSGGGIQVFAIPQ